jgi:hypothetical protein
MLKAINDPLKRRVLLKACGLMLALIVLFVTTALSPQKERQRKTVLGTWKLEITVPPQATAINYVTFSGDDSSGTFVDKNNHTGSWKLEADKISWTYTSVPNLINTFKGTLDADFKSMSGTNSGVWNGKEFKGTWVGTFQSKSE